MNDLMALARVSAELGRNRLLIQAAGGNTSVKIDDVLWVKASGRWLAKALDEPIFAALDLPRLTEAMAAGDPDCETCDAFLRADLTAPGLRPLVETTLHAGLPQRFVLHVHCVETIANAVLEDGAARVAPLLDGLKWAWVPYTRLGFPLFPTIRRASTSTSSPITDWWSPPTRSRRPSLRSRRSGGRLRAHSSRSHPSARGVERPGYRFADAPALTPHGARFAVAGTLYPDHLVFLGSGAAHIDRVVGSPPVIVAPGFPPLVRDDLAPAPLALASASATSRPGWLRTIECATSRRSRGTISPIGTPKSIGTRCPARMTRALGIDVGTSGVRAAIVDGSAAVVGYAAKPFAPEGLRSPLAWVAAVEAALAQIDLTGVGAIAIDGTSGTLVAIDARGDPLAEGSMYNDEAAPDDRAEAARAAPAHASPTSPLARALGLRRRFNPTKILHQADFIAFRLFGETFTDENNALKTGYDPAARRWPDFIAALGLDGFLPDVLPAGSVVARRDGRKIVAGTTDGCAAFLAAGAEQTGDGVTSLGSTIVLKLLVDRPVDDSVTGVYSHRVGDLWLAGGSSNSGGAVLAQYFPPHELEALAARARSVAPDRAPLLPAAEERRALSRQRRRARQS